MKVCSRSPFLFKESIVQLKLSLRFAELSLRTFQFNVIVRQESENLYNE